MRKDLFGIGAGALAGAAGGLFAALALPGLSVLLAMALGFGIGAVLGKIIAMRITPDDWDPDQSPRSYVGAHAPDDDITGPGPLANNRSAAAVPRLRRRR